MTQNHLIIVDSAREELLETYQILKLICENQGCEPRRLHILEQFKVTDIEALSDDELAALNHMTSGCILKWLT